jgi:hypothetical protein
LDALFLDVLFTISEKKQQKQCDIFVTYNSSNLPIPVEVALTTHPLLVPRLSMGRATPPHPLSAGMACYRTALPILPLPILVITVTTATQITQ